MVNPPRLIEGVKAKIYFKAMANEGADGRTYLTTDSVKMDFNVKDIQMGVDNIANGNSVIREYTFFQNGPKRYRS